MKILANGTKVVLNDKTDIKHWRMHGGSFVELGEEMTISGYTISELSNRIWYKINFKDTYGLIGGEYLTEIK